ncbi:hypothetical protein SISSUDRAFT_366461 [Sistotremastrum suecicum HHB10207 ss-3]|uniref:Uncharacterized protein n=1 Tax=Sistotremastrum suecicum HHB10207 ss-3 TaxID=1314776 RepID=A0A165Z3D2_9AGAM|nr:hypothetical protein SISSUDRAFT_366461 [Sistotremastrum suecicum HHB10207 ss-3]
MRMLFAVVWSGEIIIVPESDIVPSRLLVFSAFQVMAMTRSLPVEIIARIFESIRDNHPPGVFYPNQFREEEQTLARLARLSRTFHHEATKVLLSITAIWMCERDQSEIDAYYDEQEEWQRLHGRRQGLDFDDPDEPEDPPTRKKRPMRFDKVLEKLQSLNRNPSFLAKYVRRVYISINTSDCVALCYIRRQLRTFLRHLTLLRHIHLQTGPQCSIETVESLTADFARLAFPTIQSIKVYFYKEFHSWDPPNFEQEEAYHSLASFLASNPSLVDIDLKGVKPWPDTYNTPVGSLPRLKKFKGSLNLMGSIQLGALEELWIGSEEGVQNDVWGIDVLNVAPGTQYEHLRSLSFDLSGEFDSLVSLFDLLQCSHDFPHLELVSGCKIAFPMPKQRLYAEREKFQSKFLKLRTIVAVWSGFDAPYQAPNLHDNIDLRFHFIMKHLFPSLEVLELADAHHETARHETSYSICFQCYRYSDDPHDLPGPRDFRVNSCSRPRVVEIRDEARHFAELGIAEVFGSCIMGEESNSERSPSPSPVEFFCRLEDDKKRQESRANYFASQKWAMW